MTLWEMLDRWDARRAQRQPRPMRDIRQFIGFAFLCGYYVMVYRFSMGAIPAGNMDLIRDAMLTLGPPVGLIVGAMFRSDAREDQATLNTGRAFDALASVGRADSGAPGALHDGDAVELTRAERQPREPS